MSVFRDYKISVVDLISLFIAGILLIISIFLWYLAFISDEILLFLIATILLIMALLSLTITFISVIKNVQMKINQLEIRLNQYEKSRTHSDDSSYSSSNLNTSSKTAYNQSQNVFASNLSPEKPQKILVVTLSLIEWRIINYLRTHDLVLQGDLVDGCELSKSTISSNLSSLESKGIIKRFRRGKMKEVKLINDPKSYRTSSDFQDT